MGSVACAACCDAAGCADAMPSPVTASASASAASAASAAVRPVASGAAAGSGVISLSEIAARSGMPSCAADSPAGRGVHARRDGESSTRRYIPLHHVTSRYTSPSHTVTYRHLPLHSAAYRYASPGASPSQTVTCRYASAGASRERVGDNAARGREGTGGERGTTWPCRVGGRSGM